MSVEPPLDRFVHECLQALGIVKLCEWDVLVFLYRRGKSLLSAEQIASLLGYDKVAVNSALETLANFGYIRRSSPARGVRMNEFTGFTESRCGDEGDRILSLNRTRELRISVVRVLTASRSMTRARAGLHFA